MAHDNALNGKYTTYPEYKDSGIEWIGRIPSHWKLTRIKFITECLDGARIPLNAQERSDMQGDIPYWGANKVVDHVNDFLFDEELVLIGEDGAPFFEHTKDVSFNVSGKIWPNNHVHVLRPDRKNMDARFLKYALNCADYYLYISGSTRDKLNQSDMNDIYVRTTELFELSHIANFLDHETAKIDTLIERQQQLIKLLKDKRQAVISHTVTKGLNPDIPMRDSDVKSIGYIPKHWILKSLSLASKKLAVGLAMSVTECYEDEGVPIIRNQNIKEGYFNGSDMLYLNPAFAEKQASKKVQAGDVVIVRTGSNVGLACCVPDEYDQCHTFTTLIVTPSDELVKEYFTYCMNSAHGKAEVNRLKFGFGKDNLNVGELRAMHTLLPDVEEQREIVDFLNQEVAKVELMVSKAHIAIELMKERRTALISSAVTGKIDVRNWQAPSSSQEAINGG